MDMFRGCINSTLEELIKNYNVMYLLKLYALMKKYIVPMNSTTIFVASERQEWTKEEREENREEQ